MSLYKLSVDLYYFRYYIIPLFDYAGFLLLSWNIDDRQEFQIIQNTILRLCYNMRCSECYSVDFTFEGLEQRLKRFSPSQQTHNVNTMLYNVVRRLFSPRCEKDMPATLPQHK